jgi:hypothetical protein
MIRQKIKGSKPMTSVVNTKKPTEVGGKFTESESNYTVIPSQQLPERSMHSNTPTFVPPPQSLENSFCFSRLRAQQTQVVPAVDSRLLDAVILETMLGQQANSTLLAQQYLHAQGTLRLLNYLSAADSRLANDSTILQR